MLAFGLCRYLFPTGTIPLFRDYFCMATRLAVSVPPPLANGCGATHWNSLPIVLHPPVSVFPQNASRARNRAFSGVRECLTCLFVIWLLLFHVELSALFLKFV
jgi:hypothetical protein